MTDISHDKSKHAFAAAKQYFPGGVNSPVRAFGAVGGSPFVVKEAKGAYLSDVDGNRYIDFVLSWGPLVLGHAHPAVVQAIAAQAKRGTSYGACAEQEVALASAVRELFPSLELMRFVNSGTEAGMAVLRLARAYTKRSKILKFSGCYHGHADSLLVQAGSGVLTLGLPDSPGVLASVAQDTLTATFNDVESVKQIFERYGSDIAAIILEPVIGNAGLIVPDVQFLQFLRDISTQYGSVLIFDEVMTGFRVHLGGAQALYNITPDLTMFGKVIGGGLPVGAFGGKRAIMELLAPLGPVYQAGTLSGNPLAMAAGLATLNEWRKPGVLEATQLTAKKLVDSLQDGANKKGIPFVSTNVGSMFGFFFRAGPVKSYQEAKSSNLDLFKKFFHALLQRGVYIAPSQFEAGFVSTAHQGEPIAKACEAI